jgi:hypothetical protein
VVIGKVGMGSSGSFACKSTSVTDGLSTAATVIATKFEMI